MKALSRWRWGWIWLLGRWGWMPCLRWWSITATVRRRLVRSWLESRLLLDKVLVQMEMLPAVESLVGSVAHFARHILLWLSGSRQGQYEFPERSSSSLRAPPCQRRGR